MNIEQFLKNSLNIEKEAWAAAEAMESLTLRENSGPLFEEYAQDLTHMEETTMEVVKMIKALPKGEMRRVLAARYLYKMTWEEVAGATFLSVTHVQRVHKKGIAWLEANYI